MIVRVLLIASSLFAAARVRSAVVDQIIIGRMAERRNRIVCSVVVGGAAAPTRWFCSQRYVGFWHLKF